MAKRSYRSRLTLPNWPRRKVRYVLFRIVRGTVETLDREYREFVPTIQQHFERAVSEQHFSMSDFTFRWDVSPRDPYRVIERDLRLWVREGGSFIGRPPGMTQEAWGRHVLSTMLQNTETPPLPPDPPGFTKQR